MSTPLPPNLEPLAEPPANAKSYHGVAILDNGMQCTHHIADLDEVAAKKAKFIQEGPESVIIIADFDRTISTHFYTNEDGTKVTGQTAYSLLSESSVMAEEYRKKTKSLHDHYFPLEFDPTISFDQKYDLMTQWWRDSSNALVAQRPKMETLFKAVSAAKVDIRPGFATVVQLAYQHDIPVVVFSAGITQVIEEVLRRLGPTDLLLSNVHVIANDLIVDAEENIVTGFREPLMHSLNKKDTSVQLVQNHGRTATATHPWFQPISDRKNVLLMGDSVGDAHMSDGYEGDPDVTILKIGFLNANEEKLLDSYRKAFDIVVLHDGPMVPVAQFVADIINNKKPAHPETVIVSESP